MNDYAKKIDNIAYSELINIEFQRGRLPQFEFLPKQIEVSLL